jgi:hypothetical protein
MESQDRNIVGAMHGASPTASYIKTILGKVYVTLWDSFENQPIGMILEGDPRKKEEGCIVDVWSPDEDFYFRSKNKRNLETGHIISYVRKEEVKERSIEEYSDEELAAIVNSKFFTLQNVLNNTNSVAVLFRLKNLAQDMEKSEKLIRVIEARISELQAEEFKPLPKVTNVEL